MYGGFPAFPSFAKWMGPMGPAAARSKTARADVHSLRLGGGGSTGSTAAVYAGDWKCVDVSGSAPEGRHGHTTVVDGVDVVVFGGYAGSVSTNQVWRLKGAGEVKAAEAGAGATWERAGAAAAESSPGGVPAARWRHSACVYRGGAFVFGGNTRDKEAVNLNDVWRLDLATGRGKSANTKYSACMCVYIIIILYCHDIVRHPLRYRRRYPPDKTQQKQLNNGLTSKVTRNTRHVWSRPWLEASGKRWQRREAVPRPATITPSC